jgi:hypothetical protein
MTARKRKKNFDCVEMKRAAQREIVKSIKGLTHEQEIARIRKDIAEGPLADWWRTLPKDKGPQSAAVPSSDGSTKRR